MLTAYVNHSCITPLTWFSSLVDVGCEKSKQSPYFQ